MCVILRRGGRTHLEENLFIAMVSRIRSQDPMTSKNIHRGAYDAPGNTFGHMHMPAWVTTLSCVRFAISSTWVSLAGENLPSPMTLHQLTYPKGLQKPLCWHVGGRDKQTASGFPNGSGPPHFAGASLFRPFTQVECY